MSRGRSPKPKRKVTYDQVLRWKRIRARKKYYIQQRYVRAREKKDAGVDPVRILRRERQRKFVAAFVVNLAAGMHPREAATRAATHLSYAVLRPVNYSEGALRRRALRQLKKPEVCVALEAAAEQAGLSFGDAMGMLVSHIKGEVTKEVATATGEVVEVKLPPSLPALQTYFGMTVPKQVHQVDARVLHANMEPMAISSEDPVPPMTARKLATARILTEIDLDDEVAVDDDELEDEA